MPCANSKRLRNDCGTIPIRSHFSNQNNFMRSKLGIRMLFPILKSMSSLSNHVCNILFLCSRTKMIGIATRSRIDATVKYARLVWKTTIVNNPCDSVRFKIVFSFTEHHSKMSVSLGSYATIPRPAFIRFPNCYVRPKTFLEFWREKLIQEFWRDTFILHSISRLIVCHAPGLAIAGAFLLYATTIQRQP